jgi:hypothetical protein
MKRLLHFPGKGLSIQPSVYVGLLSPTSRGFFSIRLLRVHLLACGAILIIIAALLSNTSLPVDALPNILTSTLTSTLFLPLIYAPPAAPLTPTQFGLAFISSAEAGSIETRYQRAAAVRATVNRWPFYWSRIETDAVNQPGVFSWSAQDATTISDIMHGLTIDAILLGTPAGIGTAGSDAVPPPRVGEFPRFNAQSRDPASVSSATSPPQGLYLSVFADGTDLPGAGKAINPNNRWARFIYAAVNRYRPGGGLAQQQGWTHGEGIRVWELWNEPDLDQFFSGTYTDYARMLKVGFLSARHADPAAKMLFGGLANYQKPGWLNDTLSLIAADPDREQNGWFMDGVATHWYSYAWASFWQLYRARQTLDAFGLPDKTLWLNETGVPVWDDPPGPVNDPTALYRATMQEQAAYVIQSAAWALWMNAEAALIFQEYDDFGNGCPGIDAFGLVRNTPDALCNPGDGTPRPAYTAYGVVTRYLSGTLPYWRLRPTAPPTYTAELVALQNPRTGERVVAMWARDNLTMTVTLTATAPSAMLIYPNGLTQTVTAVNGFYSILLPWATNYNTPTGSQEAAIGGMPRILIEHDPAIVPGAIQVPGASDFAPP